MKFQQQWERIGTVIDLGALTNELHRLRKPMREAATDLKHDLALDAVAAALDAAMKKDGPAVLRHLHAAGPWALGVATKTGAAMAAKALKAAIEP
jgi:hypothetical protein